VLFEAFVDSHHFILRCLSYVYHTHACTADTFLTNTTSTTATTTTTTSTAATTTTTKTSTTATGTAAELGKVRAELAGAENRAALALAAQASSHAESMRRVAELIEEAVTGGTFASAFTLGGGGGSMGSGNGGGLGEPPLMRQSYEFNRNGYSGGDGGGNGANTNDTGWNGDGVRGGDEQRAQRNGGRNSIRNSQQHGMTPAQLLAKVNCD